MEPLNDLFGRAAVAVEPFRQSLGLCHLSTRQPKGLRATMPVFAAVMATALLWSPSAEAADRALLTVTEVIEIQAAPNRVWQVIRDFGSPKWLPIAAQARLLEGSEGRVGALREIKLENGGVVHEELAAYSDAAMSYSYRLLAGSFPADNYLSTIAVRANGQGDGSIMVWTASFRRMNPLAQPPEGQDDAALAKGLAGLYRAAMGAVKSAAEGKTR